MEADSLLAMSPGERRNTWNLLSAYRTVDAGVWGVLRLDRLCGGADSSS